MDEGDDFERYFDRLEEIVDRLDRSDDLSLDESLSLYEEGVELVERCRERLEKAEDRLDFEVLDRD
ncbi:MAG: exodeoxyribonuclease VII small subunit [Halobacteriales archaeon]